MGHYLRHRLQASTRAVHADGECSAPVFPAILFIRLSLFGCPFDATPGDNRMGTTECTKSPGTLGRNTRHRRERRVSMLEDDDADSVPLCHSSPRAVYTPRRQD